MRSVRGPYRRSRGNNKGQGSNLLPSFRADLSTTLNPQRGASTLTRATLQTYEDYQGLIRTAISGQAAQEGARGVYNLTPVGSSSEDMDSDAFSIAANASIDSATQVSFDGTSNGQVIMTIPVVDDGSGAGGRAWALTVDIRLVTGTFSGNAKCKIRQTGNAGNTGFTNLGDLLNDTGSETQRISLPIASDAAGTSLEFVIESDDPVTLYLNHWQPEEVTGQLSHAPSEYVSVGVESTPWHGAGVDAIQYFGTHNGNTVSASGVVTQATGPAINASTSKFIELDGVAGTYVSTPDSTANSQTGAMTVIVWAAADNWAVLQRLVAKWDSSSNERAFILGITGDGYMNAFITDDKTDSGSNGNNGAVTGFADGTGGWLRWTVSASMVVSCSTSNAPYGSNPRGITDWATSGSDIDLSAQSAIADSSAPIEIGSSALGTNARFAGKISNAVIIDSIDPTDAPVVDCNANDNTSGSTFASSTTGETWTKNGAAKIFGVDIPSKWDAQGPVGGAIVKAATNLATYSNTWDNAAWVVSNVTKAVNQAIAPNGRKVAGSLTASAGNGTVIQDLGSISSAKHIGGFWLKRKTGTGNIDLTINNGSTWTTAAVTNCWQRFSSVAVTAANPDVGIRIVTSGDAVWVYNGQAELGGFLTPDIETAGSAAGRNIGVLAYASSGNLSTGALSLDFDWTPLAAAMGSNVFLWGSYVDASNYTAVLHDGTNMIIRKRISGTNYDATKALTYAAGVTYQVSATFSKTAGSQIYVNGVAGTLHSNTADLQLGSTFQIGADGNGANSGNGNFRDERAYPRTLSASQIGVL